MEENQQGNHNSYLGKIIQGPYSESLKEKVLDSLAGFKNLEKMGVPVIPYISAWHEDDRVIWYEFAGRRFRDLLQCDYYEIAELFRDSVIDQRVYQYTGFEKNVEERIITRDSLKGFRQGLRDEVKKSGEVDAVYKVSIGGDQTVWLKDQASIEVFAEDNICLSVGFLTDVTKEMELKELFEKIGYIDELTKLPKRSILDRILEINIANIKRGDFADFVLMMIDIDYFKRVNDTYGHQAGDHVLASMAEVMVATKRKQDEIGRYGGEEFYGFTIGDKKVGLQFAERLRANVENTDFEYKGQKIPITISIGLASAAELMSGGGVPLSAKELLSLADKRLYAAKESGRNLVV